MDAKNTIRGLAVLMTAALGFLTASPSIRAESPAVVVVPDKLCFPGEEIHIDATLCRTGLLGLFRGGIQGEVLRFFDPEGNPLCDLLTDVSGTARIRYEAGLPGRYPFTVRLADNPRYSAETAMGSLFVQNRKSPVLFVAVEAGLVPPTWAPFVAKDLEETAPEPGSVEALSEAAACRLPVYLTQACNPSQRRIRAWLEDRGYPAGPVCCLPPSFLTGILSEAPAPDTDLIESLWKDRSVPAHLLTRDRDLAEAAADKGVHVLLLTPEDSSNGTPVNEQGEKEGKQGEKRQEEAIVTIQGWAEIPKICRCETD